MPARKGESADRFKAKIVSLLKWPDRLSLGLQLTVLFSALFGIALIFGFILYQFAERPHDEREVASYGDQQPAQTQRPETPQIVEDPDKAYSKRSNKPHPIDLSELAIEDTVLDDGTRDLSRLPPNLTLTEEPLLTDATPQASPPGQELKPEEPQESEQQAALTEQSLPVDANRKTSRKKTVLETEKPLVVVVLDDVGVNRTGARGAIGLSTPVTLAFMTYAAGVREQVGQAREMGHDVMLHFPMEPRGGQDPGPQALLTSLSEDELKARLAWGLDQFEGYVGVNNHMGSRFTEWSDGMRLVMEEMRKRKVFFMDSKTSANSVAEQEAERAGVPLLIRDIFLDNDYKKPATIMSQLLKAERIAKKQGYAIAIGHPHLQTLNVLEQWFPEARARGIEIATVSKLVDHLEKIDPDFASLETPD
ncbi:divergent polysaccharide deacetylase family protein [Kiloniella sp. b19]|uniref:divergent polysaccharide deacetylase family protein n=1 Tax=Kiloniella sp. GXU_MW_B19 TaxID=3141326 RepID=UPI0031DDF80B